MGASERGLFCFGGCSLVWFKALACEARDREFDPPHPPIYMRKKNNMKKEMENNSMDLFSRLMDRQLFGGEKTENYINRISKERAIERLRQMNSDLDITPVDILLSCQSKFGTWNIQGEELLHIMLLVI